MSEVNVEIVRRALEEFKAGVERGDPGAFFDLQCVDEEYEWVLAAESFGTEQVYRGRSEIVKFFSDFLEDLDGWSFTDERFFEAENGQVVSIGVQRATGRASGAPVEWQYGQIFELRDGCLIRVRNYRTPDEALEAAGLPADPISA